jgi:hypothetical protein
LLVFPIVVDGEQGIALIGAENQLTERAGFDAEWRSEAAA